MNFSFLFILFLFTQSIFAILCNQGNLTLQNQTTSIFLATPLLTQFTLCTVKETCQTPLNVSSSCGSKNTTLRTINFEGVSITSSEYTGMNATAVCAKVKTVFYVRGVQMVKGSLLIECCFTDNCNTVALIRGDEVSGSSGGTLGNPDFRSSGVSGVIGLSVFVVCGVLSVMV